MKPTKRKATGILAEMIAGVDRMNLVKTRNKMLLAAKIADAIKSKGLSQKTVAMQMGKTDSEISEWLSGDRNFTVDTLAEIEEYLGIHLIDTRQIGVFVYNNLVECNTQKKNITFTRSKKDWKISSQNMTTSKAS